MRVMIVTCGILGAGVSLVAQSPPEQSVTLTGCLERTFAGYLLTRVQRGAGLTPSDRPAAGVVVAASRATGSMPPRPMQDSIVTRSGGSADLDQYVNRRIKVTGTIQEPAGADGRVSAVPAADTGLTVVTVTSVHTVSPTCP